jgi:threonylcarbamoyladenosine tRNA methylthiotransferase MtaB
LSADAVRFCREARRLRPDVVFGADLIAGFPTETDAMFAQSLAHVDDCGLTYLHVFPFSPRKGTPAARMPQVARPAIKARAAQLRAKGDTTLDAYLNGQIGQEATVLLERDRVGRTPHFAEVEVSAAVDPADLEVGRLQRVRITGRAGHRLLGVMIS